MAELNVVKSHMTIERGKVTSASQSKLHVSTDSSNKTLTLPKIDLSGLKSSDSTSTQSSQKTAINSKNSTSTNSSSSTGNSLDTRNSYLSDLISNSADAFTNMFDVSITFAEESTSNIARCRITNFTAPRREVKTEEIPFQNISVKKILASSNLERQQVFNIRVDEDYQVWTTLKNKMCIDENGQFNIYNLTEENKGTIIVRSYKFDSSTRSPKVTRIWTFNDCYIISVADVTYSYGSSNGVSSNVTFIYSTYTETSPEY